MLLWILYSVAGILFLTADRELDGLLVMPSWAARGRLPQEFCRGQVVGATPGGERIGPFLLSGWGFLGQSLSSRKESNDAPKQAWVQSWGNRRVHGWLHVGGLMLLGDTHCWHRLRPQKLLQHSTGDSMFLHTPASLPFFPSFSKTQSVFFCGTVKVSQ